GNLPAGVHPFEWEEFVARFGWNSRRRHLIAGMRSALLALRSAGCTLAFIDGSFVTAKDLPGDFDACWDVSGVDPGLIDPVLLKFDDGRMAQKLKYGGELFPAQLPNGLSGKTFMEFFQTDKQTGNAKGIVALDLRRLP